LGFWRFSQSRVVTRLAIGALGCGALLLAGQAPVSAHPMTPSAAAAPFNPCPPCYTPAQLRAAYNVPSDMTAGAGQTIVIIAGFQSPFVPGDLAMFDTAFGLPAASLDTITPDGTTPFDMTSSTQRAWASEESIDVEWAHAIAPGAKLKLVEGVTGDDAAILSATKFAIQNNLGDVISMSFSEAESCPSAAFLADEHAAFAQAVAQGITLVASSGDMGAAQHSCNGAPVSGVGTPASDPLVTSVGGTHLTLDPTTDAYVSEVSWSDMAGASGGGFSSIYGRPTYQAPLLKHGEGRGVPDVAWSSALVGGATLVAIHGRIGPTAGTSSGTAAWAGIAALANWTAGHRLGELNRIIYRAIKGESAEGRFHDITSGGNGLGPFRGFEASTGWDPVTGLGTPDVGNLLAWVATTG
jgi:subtilase family serine protease